MQQISGTDNLFQSRHCVFVIMSQCVESTLTVQVIIIVKHWFNYKH